MKKIYLFIALFIGAASIAKSQCVIDTNNLQFGFWPADTSIQPIVEGVAYDTTIQLYIPAFLNDTTDTLRILSTIIDTILGLPTGVGYVQNPLTHVVSSGGRQCFEISGATLAPPGLYHLSFLGSVHVISAQLGDTVISLNDFNSVVQGYGAGVPFHYALRVQPPFIRPCTIDSAHLTSPGVYPVPSDLPCIIQTVPYDETVQGKIQKDSSTLIAGITVHVTVDSVEIDSIKGLPNGITFGRSPRVLLGGGYGCVNFAGTTTDSVGTYQLTAYGTAWLTANAQGQNFPVARRGPLNQYSSFGGYYLRVVGISDSCSLTIPSGINDHFNNLNADVSVYPNPNNGVFALKISTASAVAGQLFVYDAVGRKLYEQALNISGVYTTTLDLGKFGSGLYTLQVHTAQGTASKKISVE
ncbi:MAG: hypothetical protein JWO06_4050 [Bacteroidota bacterium]|nr:hypothetical protein [Bacteroidota bacterium]